MIARFVLLGAVLPLALDAQDTTSAKATLLAADRSSASIEATLAQVLAVDASVLFPALEILRGRAAYAPHIAAVMNGPAGRPAWTPVHAVVSRDGAFGCTTGVLHLTASDSTQPTTGRYAACWQRERDGAWRMLALSRASAPAQVTSLPDTIPGAPGSTGTSSPRAMDAAAEMTAADRSFARFSADSGGPGGAFARWIAPDGMMLGARAVPVRGKEQARRAFAGFPSTGFFEWGPIAELSRASSDGSLGFTIGEARIASTPADVSYSKYLTIWRRESDGSYRFVFDIGSDRPAPTPKQAPPSR